ncbi:MAG: NAD(P)H-dependent oxidoreductase [Desulfobacterales bacterium]
MQISAILAHPDSQSFNHAISQTVCNALTGHGHQVILHDLYAEKFDPILPMEEIPKGANLPRTIEQHCREISLADGIVIIHPNWWGQPPAILKGWTDRIVRPGIAYAFVEGDQGEGVPTGLWKGKTALVFNTSNTPHEREVKVFGDPLETLWKNCIFGLCGIERVHREMFSVIVTSTPEQRQAWLCRAEEIVRQYFPPEQSA